MKTIVIITTLHDGNKTAWTSLEKYLKSINTTPQVRTALKRRKMPFEYYGIRFERIKVN